MYIYYSMPREKKSAGFVCDSLTSFVETVKNSSEIGAYSACDRIPPANLK